MILRIQHVRPDGDVDTYHLKPGRRYHIGRGSRCEIRILDLKLSRQHCAIAFEHDRWQITDLLSTNGCLLDGEQIVGERPLVAGSRIEAGQTTLVVAGEEPAPMAVRPVNVEATPLPADGDALHDHVETIGQQTGDAERILPAPAAPARLAVPPPAALHAPSPAGTPPLPPSTPATATSPTPVPPSPPGPASPADLAQDHRPPNGGPADAIAIDSPPALPIHTSGVTAAVVSDAAAEPSIELSMTAAAASASAASPASPRLWDAAPVAADPVTIGPPARSGHPDQRPPTAVFSVHSGAPAPADVPVVRAGLPAADATSTGAERTFFITVLGRRIGPLTRVAARDLKARELKGLLTSEELESYPGR